MKLPTPAEIEIAALDCGLSIAAMCRKADTDATGFYRWKSGGSPPNLGTVQKWLDAINRASNKQDAAA